MKLYVRKQEIEIPNPGNMASYDNAGAKAAFINALKATGRNGVDRVLAALEKLGFFEAPASSRFHLAVKGGLLRHSLNVLAHAVKIAEAQVEMNGAMEEKLCLDSVVIAALLHDVCKSDVYKVEKRNRKNEKGAWEQYDAYVPTYDKIPLGHGEKSVIMLLRLGLELTMDEILAIRWHMTNWDISESAEAKGCFSAAVNKCPLLAVIASADQLATWISEGN